MQRKADLRFTAIVWPKSSSVRSSTPRNDADAGVVDEDIDRSKPCSNAFDHRGCGLAPRDADRERLTPAASDRGCDRFNLFATLAAIDRDGGARFGERQGDCRSDAARGPQVARATRCANLWR